MVNEPLPALVDLIEIDPLYVPGNKPDGCTVTEMLAGVVPNPLPTDSQPAGLVEAEAVKLVVPAEIKSV
jgi:hypothetical protein